MVAGSLVPAARVFRACRVRPTGAIASVRVRCPVTWWSYGFSRRGGSRCGAVLRAGVEELAVFGCGPDQRVLLGERQGELRRLIEALKCLLEQRFDNGAPLPVAIQVMMQRVVAGLLDEPGGILL